MSSDDLAISPTLAASTMKGRPFAASGSRVSATAAPLIPSGKQVPASELPDIHAQSRVRPSRKRTLRDGRTVLVSRKAISSPANAKSKRVHIRHGGSSRLLRTGHLDRRSTAGRLLEQLLPWWVDHLRALVGRDLTRLEQEDAADAARIELLKRLSWAEAGCAIQSGDHEARRAATIEYLRARKELHAIRAQYDTAANSEPLDIAAELAAMNEELDETI